MVNTFSMNVYSYNQVVSGGSNKLYIPVKPASVVYAQFEHISGVAAKPNQKGVSISKLQILNTLISQLVSMKSKPKADPEVAKTDLSNEQVDALIKNYQGQIQTSIKIAQNTGYGLAGAVPEAGALVNISA